MQVFPKRPLAVFCFVFIFSSLLAFTLAGFVKLAVLSVLSVVALSLLIIYIISKRKSSRVLYSFICIVFAILAITQSYFYFDKHMQKRQYNGETHTVVGIVEKRVSNADFYTAYSVKLQTVDGERLNGKMYLECEYTCALTENEIITADIFVYTLAQSIDTSYNITSLISEGYILYGVSPEEGDYNVTGLSDGNIQTFFSELNTRYSTKIINDIKGEAGGLTVALLLGNKSNLSNTVNGNFRRIGVSHVLSLSGMHMSIVIGVIELILRKIRIHKNVRGLFVALAALSYLALTGFYISAIRSVFMILSVYLCYYFATEGDSVTALFAIIATIILITPYAICDIGMWLSFLATLGILIIAPYMSIFNKNITKPIKGFSPAGKLLRYLLSSVLISFVSILSVSVITCCFFGEFSLITPLSNIIIVPFSYLLLVFSLIYMFLSGVPVLNALLVKIIQLIGNTMLHISDNLGNIRGIVVNVDYWFVELVVVIMMLLVVMSLFINIKSKGKILFVPLGAVALITISIASYQYINRSFMNVTYIKNKSSEEIVLTSRNKAVVCDFSDGSSTNLNLAYEAVGDNHITEIEVLVLSHYHERHKMSFKRLNEKTTIRNLWLPQPVSEKEYYIMQELVKIAESERVFVTIYNGDDNLFVFGDVKIEISPHTYVKRSTHPVLMMRIERGGGSLVYIGSTVHESQLIKAANTYIENADYLIFGIHGPVIKSEMNYSTIPNSPKQIIAANMALVESFGLSDEYYHYCVENENVVVGAERYKIIIK